MKTTKNLKLPQYTEEDIFDLQDINKAYDSIDKAYGELDDARKEVVNIKDEIPKTNATAEVIDARGGKETLGKRLDEFGSQLDNKASKTYVTYEEFGAIGDGINDDGEAIKKTHEYANLNNISVNCVSTKTYLIENTSNIPIKTNTNFNNATFIIKDNADNYKKHVFQVLSNYPNKTIDSAIYSSLSIKKNTSAIPQLSGNGKCLVKVENSNKKVYIRKGANATNGYTQVDYFVIDDKGNVLTDIIWDFEEITNVILTKIDETVLTITGGNFITDLYKVKNPEGDYCERSMFINRSNVVIKNMNHTIINDGVGEPYNGFIRGYECAYISIYDTVLTPRTVYLRNSDKVKMGSYDIRFDGVVGLNMYNVDGMTLDDSKWGVFTCNYAKDFYIENCKMNRFDSHMGIHNVKLKNCVFGRQAIRLIGSGTCLIEDTTVLFSDSFLVLREDYGSNWDGDIVIRRCKFVPNYSNNPKLIDFNNNGTHYFGYDCRYGKSILIEDFIFDDKYVIANGGSYECSSLVYTDANKLGSFPTNKAYPYYMPERMEFKNVRTTSGRGFTILGYRIDCMHGYKPHVYNEEIETPALKRITMETNMDIIIDNVELHNKSIENIKYSTSNIALSLNSEISNSYLEENNRVIPNLTIKNCRNVFASIYGYPMKLNLENCEIIQMVCENSGTRMKGSAVNCVFTPRFTQANLTASVKLNYKDFKFINCDFEKPYIVDMENIETNNVVSIYQFLNVIKPAEKKYIYARCFMTNCRLYNSFNINEIDYRMVDFDYKFGNHNFEKILPLTGWQSELPNLEDCPIPIGSTYYVKSTNKFLRWNGENWVE